MDKYGSDTELRCIITTSPEFPPVQFRELSRKPTIQATSEEQFEEFVKVGGDIERYYTGDGRVDLQLNARNLTGDDYKFLRELERRHTPAYIYSSVPGSIQHYIPLTNGEGGDPTGGTYTATVGTGTTVFMPRGDASKMAYLEETDFANEPILLDGIYRHSNLFSTLSDEMPLGRGVLIPSAHKNFLKNSGFADDGTDVYNWTLTDAGGADGTARKITAGWMGVPALQVWGNNVWTSDTFACAALQSEYVAISLGWRSDGGLLVEWNDGSGGGWGPLTTLTGGDGYYQTTLQLQPIAANFQLRFSLASGTYAEFCAPQIAARSAAGSKRCYPYIEGDGEDVQGEITACSMKYTGSYHAGVWPSSPQNDDSALIVCGYIMPTRPGSLMAQTQKIFSLHNSLTSKELELHMNKGTTTTRLYLRSNATALCDVEITGHSIGTPLFVAMAVGWESNTATKGIYCRPVGGSTTYSATDTGTANFYTVYDELYIGTDHDGNFGADAIFQDVSVWTGTITPCCAVTDIVEYMADEDNLTEHRLTFGRRYFIHSNLSSSPWNRDRYNGVIYCRQEKSI